MVVRVPSGVPCPLPAAKPLTRVLARQVPGGSRVKGRAYHLDGAVKKVDRHAVGASTRSSGAAVSTPSRSIATSAAPFTASCDCPYFQDRFVICKHIWAALLEAERRGHLLGDGDLPETRDASRPSIAAARRTRSTPRRPRSRAAPDARRRGARVPGRSSSRSSRAISPRPSRSRRRRASPTRRSST